MLQYIKCCHQRIQWRKLFNFDPIQRCEANKLNITRQDDVPDNIRQLKVQFPPDGINYVQSYLSRNKCHSKVMYSDRKIVKVSEGGLTQLKTLNNCTPSLKENRMKISRKNLQTLMMMTSLSSSYCWSNSCIERQKCQRSNQITVKS